MKTKFTVIFLLFAGSFQFLNAEQPVFWEFVNSFRSSLKNVYTLGSDTVYVVGEIGLIAQSPDKGKNWNIQRYSYNQYDTLNDIYFISNETGFVVGANGVILKTTDAGITWINCNSGTTQNLKAISGTGIGNIWTVGDKGTILKSRDGGDTWNTISITTLTPDFSDIGFKNGKGYIVGNLGSIYQTLNNGDNWSVQTNIEGFTGFENFKSLSITENKAFLNAGYSSVIYVNSNDLWLKSNLPGYHDYDNYDVSSTFFLNDNQGYLAEVERLLTTGGNSYGYGIIDIFKTENGGLTWSLFSGGSNNPVYSVSIIGGFDASMSFVNKDTGYLISENRMYRIPFVGDIDADFYGDVNNQKENTALTLEQNDKFLNIKYSNIPISSIKLISLSGQIVYQRNNSSDNTEIIVNISNYNKGVYIIQVNLKDNTQMRVKWIKH